MVLKDYISSLPNTREEVIKKIAEECCSHPSSVYRWIHGTITPPMLKQKIISKLLNIPVEELFPPKEVVNERVE